jgi:superfamily I DNA and RNA helicase
LPGGGPLEEMIPDESLTDYESERWVFAQLRDDPSAGDWMVLHSVGVDNHPQRAVDALVQVLGSLLADRHYMPADIVILSPHNTKSPVHRITSPPWSEKLRPFDPTHQPDSKGHGAICYASVWAFKGLEAPVVVLTDVEEETQPAGADLRQLFYAAASRAPERVIVVGGSNSRPEWL